MHAGTWIGLVALATSGAFAAWIGWTTRPVRARRVKVALLCAAGALMAAWASFTDDNLRAETLFEVVAEGNLGLAPGTPAPEHVQRFVVLHPGVVHKLTVYPEYPPPTAKRARFDAEVRVQVLDQDGVALVDASHVHTHSRYRRDWDSVRYEFTPTREGEHTLVLAPLTAGIPAVHARIVDPLGVPNGRRAPGW
ncbi:MAG: hypothetical protein R3F49_12530 [Planctomycetota bacterium]